MNTTTKTKWLFTQEYTTRETRFTSAASAAETIQSFSILEAITHIPAPVDQTTIHIQTQLDEIPTGDPTKKIDDPTKNKSHGSHHMNVHHRDQY